MHWEIAFNMHYTAKEHLITNDNGMANLFEQKCVFQPNDQRLAFARLKYVRWVEKNLELNYGVLNKVVFFSD
jgi:hypothetical protein